MYNASRGPRQSDPPIHAFELWTHSTFCWGAHSRGNTIPVRMEEQSRSCYSSYNTLFLGYSAGWSKARKHCSNYIETSTPILLVFSRRQALRENNRRGTSCAPTTNTSIWQNTPDVKTRTFWVEAEFPIFGRNPRAYTAVQQVASDVPITILFFGAAGSLLNILRPLFRSFLRCFRHSHARALSSKPAVCFRVSCPSCQVLSFSHTPGFSPLRPKRSFIYVYIEKQETRTTVVVVVPVSAVA